MPTDMPTFTVAAKAPQALVDQIVQAAGIGLSVRKIAFNCQTSRLTVREVLKAQGVKTVGQIPKPSHGLAAATAPATPPGQQLPLVRDGCPQPPAVDKLAELRATLRQLGVKDV